MYIIRVLFSALAALLLLSNGLAQDERVHPYMKAVKDQFPMDEGFYLEVDYIREDIMRETRGEGEGIIWMKGFQYRMEVDEYMVYFDGEKQYSYNTDMEEVYVSEPNPDDAGYLQAVPMSVILTYQQDFRYQFMGQRSFMDRQAVEIQLYPLEVSGPYSMLKLFVHPHSMELEGFMLKHKEGINYTLVLRTIKGKLELTEKDFRFDPAAHPDAEVIELIQ
jgi:hypothetical protein